MNSKHYQIYVKTAEHCQLNCKHCYSSGREAPVQFFDPRNTLDFLYRLKRDDNPEHLRIVYHGGEPMLAPLEDLKFFDKHAKEIMPEMDFGIQTNLVYKLDDEKREFFFDAFRGYGIGTSYDADIRFENKAQHKLWEKNVGILNGDGHYTTLMVSITRGLIEQDPIQIIKYAIDLGFDAILFERITIDGNANAHKSLFPNNKEIDEWIVKMWDQSIKHQTWRFIHNMFLSEIATSMVNRTHVANRCRNCEQTLLTINASGTIGGCPNSAPKDSFGHVRDNVLDVLQSEGRTNKIVEEMIRNPICHTCDVQSFCNGDCYKLSWDTLPFEGMICPAPKSLFQRLAKEMDVELYEKLI